MGEHSVDCVRQSIRYEFTRRVQAAVEAAMLSNQPASGQPLFEIAELVAHELNLEHRQHFPGRWVPSVTVHLLAFPLLFGIGAIGLEIQFTHRAGSSLN